MGRMACILICSLGMWCPVGARVVVDNSFGVLFSGQWLRSQAWGREFALVPLGIAVD